MPLSAPVVSTIPRGPTRVRYERRSPSRPVGTERRPSAATVGDDHGESDAPPPSDEALLGRYRDLRRHEDFAELVQRHSAGLGRYLCRYLGDAALAEDVLQDTFLQVHSKCTLYRDDWPARSWLYSVATHRAVDAVRRFRRLPAVRLESPRAEGASVRAGSLVELLAAEGPGPLEELEERERHAWVRESVARLPEPLREILGLAYYQGLPYAEVAGLLQIPLGTVKSRLHAAIARLRTMAEHRTRTGVP
jgi:RNA polymerase sigma-70 factor (ECF subfamily)